MPPLVTILIPTFNRCTLLCEAIESALAQNYSNLEIIVSDNASTDKTQDVVREYLSDHRLKYFRNSENIGLVGNWRRGIEEYASGEWFVILSDDDYLTDPHFISNAIQMTALNDEIRVVFAAGNVRYDKYQVEIPMQIPYSPIEDGKNIFINRDAMVKPVEFILCGLIIHRQTALGLKPFADSDNLCCDAGLYFKLCLDWKVAVLHDPVCVYREHGSNTLKSFKSWAQQVAILRMYFELWKLAKASGHFSTEQLGRWRQRVLLRACRTFIIGVRLYMSDHHSTAESIAEIRAQGPIQTRELFSDPSFLIKFMLASSPVLYSKLMAFRVWNNTMNI